MHSVDEAVGKSLNESGFIYILLYLSILLLTGWLAKRAQREASLKDYYLAGGSLGSISLFFTLYATQYSGNSLVGSPGQAYRHGFIPLGIALGMMGIVLVYSLFAPRLNQLAKQNNFITLGDFIRWRFNDPALLIAVNTIVVIALVSYGLANFKAVGLLLESASGGNISFVTATLILALVMAIYESLGGMRGVVWTDMLQGLLLLAGSALLFIIVYQISGGSGVMSLQGFSDEFSNYLTQQVNLISFISLILLTSFAAAMYPQAIQRVYASRNANTLKRAYKLLFFMPLITIVPMILVGISAKDLIPGLNTAESERVIIHLISHISQTYPSLSWLLILYICAVIAAIMSTIDSALLTLGSTCTQDILNRDNNVDQQQLHKQSRMISWVLMASMAILAITLPQTIWALMVFKLELLIQIAPAIILGVRINDKNSHIRSKAIFYGLIAGAMVAVCLKTTDYNLPGLAGVHAGVIGVMVNLGIISSMTWWHSHKKQPV